MKSLHLAGSFALRCALAFVLCVVWSAEVEAATVKDGGQMVPNADGTSWTYNLVAGGAITGLGSTFVPGVGTGAGAGAASAEFAGLMQTLGVSSGGRQLATVAAVRGVSAAAIGTTLAGAAAVAGAFTAGYALGDWFALHGIEPVLNGGVGGLAGLAGYKVDPGAPMVDTPGTQYSMSPGTESSWAATKEGACAKEVASLANPGLSCAQVGTQYGVWDCSNGRSFQANNCLPYSFNFSTRQGINRECQFGVR